MLHGLRLQLPLPLQIETSQGTKEGQLVSGDFDGAKLQVQFGEIVAAPSKAAKLARGVESELNGLRCWKWSPSPGELYTLPQKVVNISTDPLEISSSSSVSNSPSLSASKPLATTLNRVPYEKYCGRTSAGLA